MSALVFLLPPLPVPSLERHRLRLRLARAERAVDQPFSRQASLWLDRCVVALEWTPGRDVLRTLRPDLGAAP
jgi:hypothetical protein